MLCPLHGGNVTSCLIRAWFFSSPLYIPQKTEHFTVCIARFCRIWLQEKPNNNNTKMKKATYFRHNILEQQQEVTTGANLHEIALGTNELSFCPDSPD